MAGDTDALELLTADHRNVEELFARYEEATEPQRRTEIVHDLVHELAVHGEVEELIFYPRLREALPDGDDLADESVEEHVAIKQTLNELDSMTAEDDGFDERMADLIDEVRHHVEEEEEEIFPRIREAVSHTDLRKMGDLIEEAKLMVPTRPHPHAPTSPLGKLVVGGPVALIDRVRDALREATDRPS